MYVIEKTGEITACQEVDVFDDYVWADMVLIPTKDVAEIWEETEDGLSNVFVQGA